MTPLVYTGKGQMEPKDDKFFAFFLAFFCYFFKKKPLVYLLPFLLSV